MDTIVRVKGGEDDMLFVRRGAPDPRFSKAAVERFRKATGAKGLASSGSVDLPDDLPSLIHINNRLCPGVVCPLYGSKPVYPRGPANPLVCFIGEAPGEQEENHGISFVGRSGDLLETLRFKAGFKEEECTYLNILQCRPPDNRTPTRIESVCCSWRLAAALERLHPKAVIMVGKTAANFMLPVYRLDSERSALEPNLLRAVDFGVMRFLHIRHPSYILHRGGLTAKKNAKLIEDTLFTMRLLRELLVDRHRDAPKKFVWNWREQHPKMLAHELSAGNTVRTDR